MTPDEYARGVVAAVLKTSTPAWFWHGNSTTLVWFLDTFFPRTIWVSNRCGVMGYILTEHRTGCFTARSTWELWKNRDAGNIVL